MITKEEVQSLIDVMSQSVIHTEYPKAFTELQKIYDKHLYKRAFADQIQTLTDFMNMVIDLYSPVTRGAAVAGIAVGEFVNKFKSNRQLATMLELGRAIFNDADPKAIHKIMINEFGEESEKLTLEAIEIPTAKFKRRLVSS